MQLASSRVHRVIIITPLTDEDTEAPKVQGNVGYDSQALEAKEPGSNANIPSQMNGSGQLSSESVSITANYSHNPFHLGVSLDGHWHIPTTPVTEKTPRPACV